MTTFQKQQSGRRLSQLLQAGYLKLHEQARDGAFVVWIAINVPAELFAGFDNVVFAVPESHAALNAGKGLGVLQSEKAENLGYSPDLCSYARIDIGSVSDGGRDSPTFGLPAPHLLVSNTNNCGLLVKWFDVHHRQMQVPHFILDVPFCYGPQQPLDLDYIVRQFKDLIRTIETLSGQTFDHDKAAQAVAHTHQALGHWKRFIGLAAHRPAPLTAFDTFVQMAPFLTLRGTSTLTEHYRLLADETTRRIQDQNFPVPDETYRLFWDSIAPWHQLRAMSTRLAGLKANIVAATYTSCIGSVEGDFAFYPYEGGDPLTYLARTQNSTICPHGLDLRFQAMQGAIKDYHIDGVIFASNRSCKPYSITQYDQQQRIERTCGVPAVSIEIDHADARKYNEANSFLRIEALLERIPLKI
jgi:benzoyl-CoA reductase/2-hydroxyglutaryl-CoA dehydratase subunit BcrC/BadD/HgdB